jgi:hypothetical protein
VYYVLLLCSTSCAVSQVVCNVFTLSLSEFCVLSIFSRSSRSFISPLLYLSIPLSLSISLFLWSRSRSYWVWDVDMLYVFILSHAFRRLNLSLAYSHAHSLHLRDGQKRERERQRGLKQDLSISFWAWHRKLDIIWTNVHTDRCILYRKLKNCSLCSSSSLSLLTLSLALSLNHLYTFIFIFFFSLSLLLSVCFALVSDRHCRVCIAIYCRIPL